MTFDQRLQTGRAFEAVVCAGLIARGWECEPFGQGQLTDRVRQLLQKLLTPVRWMPDLIALKASGTDEVRAIFVDAKAGDKWRQTGNHDIQVLALEGAAAWEKYSGCPVYFAFTDGAVCTPDVAQEVGRPGPYYGNGSGTRFLLIDRAACIPCDVVFGVAA